MPHPTNHESPLAWWDMVDRLGEGDDMLPRLTIDADVAWEIYLPAWVLDYTDLVNVTITIDGIYVENTNGDWDIIPFAELSELLQSAGCRNLDERICIGDPRLTIIAKLGDTVRRSPGQPGYVATGAQLIQATKAPTDRSL